MLYEDAVGFARHLHQGTRPGPAFQVSTTRSSANATMAVRPLYTSARCVNGPAPFLHHMEQVNSRKPQA